MLRTFLASVAVVLALAPASARAQSADAITPFTIRVPDAVLTDLQARLKNARYPQEITGTGWTYGTDLAYLKSLVNYWQNGYDWRAQERKLNQLPQFKTVIDGLEIHFVHQKSKVPGAFPLALTHGWPGSIYEFTK